MHDAPRIDEHRPFEHTSQVRHRRRRSVRRAVNLEVTLQTNGWDGSVVLPATDLSNEGLWVETPYALDEGEELVVSFDVPDAPQLGRIWAIAEVARVGLWRRRHDAHASGMGLRFTCCSSDDSFRLREALHGRPPPLPEQALRKSAPPPLPHQNIEPRGRARAQNAGVHSAATIEDAGPPAVLDWLLASE